MLQTICKQTILLLSLACLPAPTLAAVSDAGSEKLSLCPQQETIKNAREHYSREQSNIKQSDGKVVRNGKRLELQTRARKVVFEDNCTASEAYARYSFESYIKDKGYYLLKHTGYEWGGFFLINDRTGDKTELLGEPVFSPDGKRLITVSMDIEAGELLNAIRIYRIDPDGAALEYNEDFEQAWGPSDPVWLDNAKIRFTKNTCANPCTKFLSSTAFLVNKDNKWTIQDSK